MNDKKHWLDKIQQINKQPPPKKTNNKERIESRIKKKENKKDINRVKERKDKK